MYFSRVLLQLVVTGAILGATFVLFSFQPAAGHSSKRSIGEEIFRNRCTVCHGVDGSGDTAQGKKLKVPDLRSEKVQKLADDEIFDAIMEGKGEMPAFKKKLSTDGVHQVITHVRTLSRKS